MNDNKVPRSRAITRRTLRAGAAIVSSGLTPAATRIATPDLVIRSGDLSIAVAPMSYRALVDSGQEGAVSLYGDDGLTHRYEQGAAARTMLESERAAGVLTRGSPGTCPGMTKSRAIRARLMRPGEPCAVGRLGCGGDYSG